MSMNQSKDSLPLDVARSLREHWLLFVVEGIVLLVLGLLAVLLPPLATLGVTIFLGWLFLISGVMGLTATFWARQAPGFWWSLLSAVLGIAAGLVLLLAPVGSEGIGRRRAGITHRRAVVGLRTARSGRGGAENGRGGAVGARAFGAATLARRRIATPPGSILGAGGAGNAQGEDEPGEKARHTGHTPSPRGRRLNLS